MDTEETTKERNAFNPIKNVGGLSISKGRSKEVQTSVWDAIPKCNPMCTIFNLCPHNPYDEKDELTLIFYNKEDEDRFKDLEIVCTSLCTLRKKYLNSCHSMLQNSIHENTDLSQHAIGMMLIPLYSHLVSFKIKEYSLGGSVMNSRGGVHTIYREMRDTIRTINTILKDLGIMGDQKKGYVNPNSTYYDTLMEGEVIS